MSRPLFAIFPCRGKVPLTEHGCRDAPPTGNRSGGGRLSGPPATGRSPLGPRAATCS